MTRGIALILWAAALFLPAAADAADPRLVPDVSSRAIDIQYSFTGEELLLFGAILYPGQRLPDDRADIVVVLKGPVRPIILREKRRVAGSRGACMGRKLRPEHPWHSANIRAGTTSICRRTPAG